MKKTCFILIMIMAVCVSKAQTTLSRYDIRYSTEHHVLTKDGYVNVVDIDLEWPDVVEFGKAEKLQKALEKETLGTPLTVEKHVGSGNFCIKQGSLYFAWFAKDFSGGLVKSLSKNVLVPQRATLSQVVRWTSEDSQETWVPLFRVEFGKEIT